MKYTSLFLLIFLALESYSQDQLFKRDNTKVEVKILEISPTEIKYKLFTYQDGPTIIVSKSEVALIIFQNGTHEVIKTPAQPVIMYAEDVAQKRAWQSQHRDSLKAARYKELTTNRNVVSLNMLEPFNGGIGINYLREFYQGLFHVYVPVAIGVAEPFFNQTGNSISNNSNTSYVSNYRYSRKTIEAGIGFHLHTSGKRVVTHFIGPYIGMAQFTGSYEASPYTPYPYGPRVPGTSHGFVMNRYTFMLDNGLLIRIHKNINMMLLAGFGYHSDDYIKNNPKNFNWNRYSYYNNKFPINSIKLGVSIGYRF